MTNYERKQKCFELQDRLQGIAKDLMFSYALINSEFPELKSEVHELIDCENSVLSVVGVLDTMANEV